MDTEKQEVGVLLHHKGVYIASLALLAVYVFFACFEFEVRAWASTLWIYDYHFGFIKRGLLGAILGICSDVFSQAYVLSYFQGVISFALAALLTVWLYRYFKNTPLLLFAIVLAGFSLQQISYDSGRFDQINYVLLIIGLWVIEGEISSLTKFVVLSILASVMLLVHEASILMHIPLLFSAWLLTVFQRDQPLLCLLLSAVFVILVFFLIVIYGRLEDVSYNEFSTYLSLKARGFEVQNSALIIIDRSLSDNVQLTLERLIDKKTASRMLMLSAVNLPFIYILMKSYRQLKLTKVTLTLLYYR